jgi:hypothetical protein
MYLSSVVYEKVCAMSLHRFFIVIPLVSKKALLRVFIELTRGVIMSDFRLLSENKIREVHNKMFVGLTNLKTL